MRNCKYCSSPIGQDKRSDSVFCSNTCKGKYHEEHKQNQSLSGTIPEIKKEAKETLLTPHKKETDDELGPFRNLIGEEPIPEKEKLLPLPVQYISRSVLVPHIMYSWVKSDLEKMRANIKGCMNEINRLKELIETEKRKDGTGIYVTTSGTGAWFGYQIASEGKKKTTDGEKLLGAFIGGLAGLWLGNMIDSGVQPDREKVKAANIKKMNEVLQIGHKTLAELQKKEAGLLIELARYPETTSKTEQVLNPAYVLALKEREKTKSISGIKVSTEPVNGVIDVSQTSQTSETSKAGPLETDKILSAKNMTAVKMKTLHLKGRWENLLGLIQTTFFLVVHGMSGEGKTHFTIQFAKYLAENFGNVLYVSGEEGFAPTFQNKIKSLGAEVPKLFIGDFRTGEELLKEVPNKYHFIVIDSTNNMEIDPDLMKAIRQRFKQSGFIAVCQSTKDDKIRGSYKIVHDSDITIKVKDGIATTTKNRFKEKGTQFDVFEAYKNKGTPNKPEKPNDTLDEDFRNTI